MTFLGTKSAVALILVSCALAAPSARAYDGFNVVVGYGQAYQTRQDVDSTAHLGMIGAAGRFSDDLFGVFDFQFGIDSEYADLTHLSLSMMAGYAFGPEAFTFWLGGGLRFGMDGYPNPSASLYDPGVGLGFLSSFGTVGFGADLHAWLGWNFYSDRRSDDISMEFEPYIEWRAYLTINL